MPCLTDDNRFCLALGFVVGSAISTLGSVILSIQRKCPETVAFGVLSVALLLIAYALVSEANDNAVKCMSAAISLLFAFELIMCVIACGEAEKDGEVGPVEGGIYRSLRGRDGGS